MASRLDYIGDWDTRSARAHFRVTKLAKDCGVSDRQLRRYFLKRFGKSPREWMALGRLEGARSLLATGKSIKEVAAQSGFNHQSNFSRSFKHHYKATPSSHWRTI